MGLEVEVGDSDMAGWALSITKIHVQRETEQPDVTLSHSQDAWVLTDWI